MCMCGRVISRTVITNRLRAAAAKLIMMLQPKTQDGKGRKESLHLILHSAALRLIIDLCVAEGVIRRLTILACWRAACIFMRRRNPTLPQPQPRTRNAKLINGILRPGVCRTSTPLVDCLRSTLSKRKFFNNYSCYSCIEMSFWQSDRLVGSS